MVPFGGWDMPVQYSGIISEVESVRTKVGIFDVSHMGRLYISGPSATEFLDWMLTGSASNKMVKTAAISICCVRMNYPMEPGAHTFIKKALTQTTHALFAVVMQR